MITLTKSEILGVLAMQAIIQHEGCPTELENTLKDLDELFGNSEQFKGGNVSCDFASTPGVYAFVMDGLEAHPVCKEWDKAHDLASLATNTALALTDRGTRVATDSGKLEWETEYDDEDNPFYTASSFISDFGDDFRYRVILHQEGESSRWTIQESDLELVFGRKSEFYHSAREAREACQSAEDFHRSIAITEMAAEAKSPA